MRLRLAVIGLCCFLLGLSAVAFAAEVDLARNPIREISVPTAHGERVVAVFVDSLSDDLGRDAELMPELSSLAARGAAFEVEPCRDQLTFLCLQAAFSGRDESRLLTLADNFAKDRRSTSETLIHALARDGRAVIAVGSNELAAFRDALRASHYLTRTEENDERLLSAWSELEAAEHPALTLLGLGRGDLAAHAHGPGSPEYREAFGSIDRTIGAIDRQRDPTSHLVIFGDHGHDRTGSHLPGGEGKTWSVYVGPALRAGLTEKMPITAHRTLLGVLLGTPVPAEYDGPALERLFEPAWVSRALAGRLPVFERGREPARAHPRAVLLFGLTLAAALLLYFGFRTWSSPQRAALFGALALTVTAAAAGHGYDAIRRVLHDQGFSPERSLYLFVPAALGIFVAVLLRRTQLLRPAAAGAWLPTGAAIALLVTLVCLFPSAYFYGSSRAVVTISLFVLGALSADIWRDKTHDRRARWSLLAANAFAAVTLITFLRVGRADSAAPAAGFVLKSAIYQGSAWLPLIAAKLAVFALLAPKGVRRPLDLAGTASLLTASLLVQLGSASIHRYVYAALALLLVATFRTAAERAPSTQLAAGLLLLNHLYGSAPLRVAPIELLLSGTSAALIAWRRSAMRTDSLEWASGLTLATSAYLLLWPLFGFRLSGVDFRFMFQWIPEQRHDDWWWLIALGTLAKFAMPYLLLGAIARKHGAGERAGWVALSVIAARVLVLSVMVATYALGHSTSTELAVDMLAELVLVTLCLPWIAAWSLGSRGGARFNGGESIHPGKTCALLLRGPNQI